jgi:hypothetical protein
MNTDSSLSPTNTNSTLTNTSSNLNMMQTGISHHEQYQSINDNLFPASNDVSLSFSKSVTNAMFNDNEYLWMRLDIHKNDVLKIHKSDI